MSLFRGVFENLLEKQFPAPDRSFVDKKLGKSTAKKRKPNSPGRSEGKSKKRKLNSGQSTSSGRTLRNPPKKLRVIYSDDESESENIDDEEKNSDVDFKGKRMAFSLCLLKFQVNRNANFCFAFLLLFLILHSQSTKSQVVPIMDRIVAAALILMNSAKIRHQMKVNRHFWMMRSATAAVMRIATVKWKNTDQNVVQNVEPHQ